MNLTKEHFDKALMSLATRSELKSFSTKDDLKKFVTQDELDERFERQTRLLMAYFDEQTEALVAIVAKGFEEIKALLDVRERMALLEKDMSKIKDTLQV